VELFSEPIEKTKKNLLEVVDYMSSSLQGMYFDSKAKQLGYDPGDPGTVDEIEKRLKVLKNSSVEEYMAIQGNDRGSLGVQAARKQNQEKALQDMLEFYSKKHGLDKKSPSKK
jgi:hypothetical protein